MRAPGDAHVSARYPASVYTEMNAISKGVSLGLYKEGKQEGNDDHGQY